MRIQSTFMAIAFAVHTIWNGTALAALLDQDNLHGNCCRISVIGPDVLQQTITGGMTGTLERIVVEVGGRFSPYEIHGNGTVTFSLYEGAATPLSTPVFSENIDITSVTEELFLWDVSSQGLALNSGDVLTFGLTGLGDGNGATFADDIDNHYAGGSLFLNGSMFEPPRDLAFRTYVIPIPEPSTFLLALLGMLGLVRRRA